VGGKRARAAQRVAGAAARYCADVDAFGLAEPPAIHAAALAESVALVGDLFGPYLDDVLIVAAADSPGAACQARALDAALDGIDALWKLTVARKRVLLRPSTAPPIASGAALGEALETHLRSDPRGAISSIFASLEQDAGRVCGTTDLAAAFPGCAPADAAELGACAERAARCRFCRTLDAFDGLALDCDAFDDDEADASCS
jgi:hypothetical protein